MLANTVLLAGCAGREANLVQIRQPGDKGKTCEELETEMLFCQDEIARLLPKSDKTGSNIALGATGIIFIVPLFFMDLKQGEKKEIEAYQQRYNYLFMLFQQKNCVSVSDRMLSPEKDQKLSEEMKKQQTVYKNDQSSIEQNAPITSGLTIIKCENCGNEIGKLEKAYVYEGHVVCSQCYLKLKQQP